MPKTHRKSFVAVNCFGVAVTVMTIVSGAVGFGPTFWLGIALLGVYVFSAYVLVGAINEDIERRRSVA